MEGCINRKDITLMNFKNKKYEDKGTLKKRLHKEIKRNWQLYLLVLLPLTYLIIFKYIPMYGVQIAFRDYKVSLGIWESEWVGLKHFQRFLSNYKFEEILWNTIIISLYSFATFPFPIILALALNSIQNQRFKKLVQTVTYIPHFISTVIMVGMIIQFLDARSGVINQIITLFGGEAQNFMAKPEYFRHIYVWTGVWQGIGYGSIMYLAALTSISPELHEAATLDGANLIQRIWHVDIPGIMPTISIMLIMRCGTILGVGYEKVYLMQNSLNLRASEVISTYVYKQGLESAIPQYSYSAAIGLFVTLINMIMLIICNKLCDKLSGSSLF